MPTQLLFSLQHDADVCLEIFCRAHCDWSQRLPSPACVHSACSVMLATCKGNQVQHREVVQPEVKVVESCHKRKYKDSYGFFCLFFCLRVNVLSAFDLAGIQSGAVIHGRDILNILPSFPSITGSVKQMQVREQGFSSCTHMLARAGPLLRRPVSLPLSVRAICH